MIRFKILIFSFVLLSYGTLYSQRFLKVSFMKNGNTEYISSFRKNGINYISAKETAKVIAENSYFNKKANKIEIKFNNYNLKFTAKSNFVVLTSKSDKSSRVFQMPLPTLFLNNDIFLPVKFCTKYLSLAAESKLKFDRLKKQLAFGSGTLNTSNILKFTGSTKNANLIYDIYRIDLSEKANGTLVRLKAKEKLRKPGSSLRNNKIYLFFSKATVNPYLLTDFKAGGLVAGISSKIINGNPQFIIKLKPGYDSYEVSEDVSSNDILVSIHNKFLKNRIPKVDLASKWNFETVVIDAGHGGKDPGAIGVSGVKEKDVNLGIALKLGNLIKQKLKNVKVIYTRKSDKFVELYKRGKIANEHHGNLFISIHANSLKRKPSNTRGFEVYLLRPGRTEEAIEIAEVENSVIKYEDNPNRYKKLTDENFILVSMARSSFMRFSEKFSDFLNSEWKKEVKIPSRGIKQAGFYVLVGASMPSVLIETGYLSNKKDENYLSSKKGQMEIAKAIFKAIVKYKNYYTKSIENYNG